MTAGRGTNKINPDAVADKFWAGFARNTFEMPIGRSKQLLWLNRLLPKTAERIMWHS